MSQMTPEELRRLAQESAVLLEDAFRSMADNIYETFDRALGATSSVADATSRDIERSFAKFAKITDPLVSNANKIAQGLIRSKDIQRQIVERKSQQAALEARLVIYARQLGEAATDINDVLASTNTTLASIAQEYLQAVEANEELIQALEGQQKQAELLNDKLGLTGDVLRTITKIPVARHFIDAEKALDSMRKTAMEGGNQIEIFASGIKSTLINLERGTIILAVLAAAKEAAGFIKDLLFQASDQTTNIQRALNVTKDVAVVNRQLAFEASNESRNYLANVEEILSSQDEINRLLGTQVNLLASAGAYGKDLVQDYAAARDALQLSKDALEGGVDLSILQGKSLRTQEKTVLALTTLYNKNLGYNISQKTILEKTFQITGEIRNSMQGNLETLTESVYRLQTYGLTLEQIKDTSKNLVDFESSLSNELQAELFLQRDLNLDRARYLAMTRDYVKLGDEMVKQGFTYEEASKMNVFQLEAAASALGMQSETFVKMLEQQKVLNNLRSLAKSNEISLNQKQYDSEVAIYEQLKKRGVLTESLTDALGEQALANLEAQTASQSFERVITKLKDKIGQLADGDELDKFIQWMTWFTQKAMKDGLWSAMWSSPEDESSAPPTRRERQEEILLYKERPSAADFYSMQGPGPKFATGGIVTSEVKNATVGEAGAEAIIPLHVLFRHFDKMTSILTEILRKEGTVTIDGLKAGTAFGVSSYSLQ